MSSKPYGTLAECTVAGVRVQKLKSTRTGILVYLAQVEGPLVNGYFCLGESSRELCCQSNYSAVVKFTTANYVVGVAVRVGK